MAKITIVGEIGWDVTEKSITEQFSKIKPNEDLEIDLSSAGGSVFQGVKIANLIRDHKGKTTLTISSVALSMGSYISQRADIVKVHDDSTWMMHNPWIITAGDFQDLEKTAKMMKSLAVMTSSAYSTKSGKAKPAVQKLMNDTTWLFGQEIVDAGFADEIIETEKPDDKDDAVAFARLQFSECMVKLKTLEGIDQEFEKIAALLPITPSPAKSPENPKLKKENMNPEQFLAYLEKHPEVKAAHEKALEDIKAKIPDIEKMSLSDFLEKSAQAKTEHETAIETAKTEASTAAETGKMSVSDVNQITKLVATGKYGTCTDYAAKCFAGSGDPEVFKTMVAQADQIEEKFKLLEIKKNQPAGTPSEEHDGLESAESLESPKIKAKIEELRQIAGVA